MTEQRLQTPIIHPAQDHGHREAMPKSLRCRLGSSNLGLIEYALDDPPARGAGHGLLALLLARPEGEVNPLARPADLA